MNTFANVKLAINTVITTFQSPLATIVAANDSCQADQSSRHVRCLMSFSFPHCGQGIVSKLKFLDRSKLFK